MSLKDKRGGVQLEAFGGPEIWTSKLKFSDILRIIAMGTQTCHVTIAQQTCITTQHFTNCENYSLII